MPSFIAAAVDGEEEAARVSSSTRGSVGRGGVGESRGSDAAAATGVGRRTMAPCRGTPLRRAQGAGSLGGRDEERGRERERREEREEGRSGAAAACHLHEREKEEGAPFYMRGPWWSPVLPTPLHSPARKIHCPWAI